MAKKTSYSYGTQVVNNNFVEMEETYISSGATSTGVVDLGAASLVAVVFPLTMTSSTFTIISSDQASGGFHPTYKTTDGSEWTGVTLSSGRHGIPPSESTYFGRYIVVCSGPSGSPVAETARKPVRICKKNL